MEYDQHLKKIIIIVGALIILLATIIREDFLDAFIQAIIIWGVLIAAITIVLPKMQTHSAKFKSKYIYMLSAACIITILWSIVLVISQKFIGLFQGHWLSMSVVIGSITTILYFGFNNFENYDKRNDESIK